MTPDLWLEAHSYLRPIAGFAAQVDRAAAGIDVLEVRMPDWEDYRADFLAGVPLLRSSAAAVDLEPGGRMAQALLESLASGPSTGRLAEETRALATELRHEPQAARRIADFLLGDEALTPPFPGLLRYLGWTAMARFLRPVVSAFDGWRDENYQVRDAAPGKLYVCKGRTWKVTHVQDGAWRSHRGVQEHEQMRRIYGKPVG